MIGQTLLHFEITAKLGEGGMGEVYRATDTKLGRDVALKVLPEAFAQDSERMARFAREAQVLASLNHNNIAAIYSLEAAGLRAGRSDEESLVNFLVMELVEGETLSERIDRGAVPLEESARIALQITEAVEAAHEKGIVHRDLKPANVKLTPEGQVKVLDFGLAKALEDEVPEGDLANSPTLTAAATQAGIIMGTAAYMSPEQAAAGQADRRSDIWSFGVVLAEMLTGQQQFQGQTVSHVLASVLKDDPDLKKLPDSIPPRLVDLLERCLRKEPKQRLQAIGDARILLQEFLADPEEFQAAPIAREATSTGAPSGKSAILPWIVAAVAGALAVGAFIAGDSSNEPEPPPTRRFLTELERPALNWAQRFAFSPNGDTLVYVSNEPRQLMMRRLDQLESIPIAGTEGAQSPFFSPDGKWIGFRAGGSEDKLKKVPVGGGPASPITPAPRNILGAHWASDGTIYFSTFDEASSTNLYKVSASGGTPEALIPREGEDARRDFWWPSLLPGEQTLLLSVAENRGGPPTADVSRVEIMDLATGSRSQIMESTYFPAYSPSGHIIAVAGGGVITAVPFDLDTLRTRGAPVALIDGIHFDRTWFPTLGLSADGTFAYTAGSGEPDTFLFWVDRDGRSEKLSDKTGYFEDGRLSPDGTRVAVGNIDSGTSDLWVIDIDRGTMSLLTEGPGTFAHPVWSPDGERIFYAQVAAGQEGTYGLVVQPSDASGAPQTLTTSEVIQLPTTVSPDGRHLGFHTRLTAGGQDSIFVLDLETGEVAPFLETENDEDTAQFSPDGRWIAYESNKSGQDEIYVRPFPGPGAEIQISTNGGNRPLWSADGTELFYAEFESSNVMMVRVDLGAVFSAASPQVLFSADQWNVWYLWDVTSDGEKFLRRGQQEDLVVQTVMVTNWFEELQRLAPPDAK